MTIAAVITAAGRGSRLGPLGSVLPKAFLPVEVVGGRVVTAIERLLGFLDGFSPVVVVGNGDPWFQELTRGRPDVLVVSAPPAGEWTALRAAFEALCHPVSTLLVVSCDNVFFPTDLTGILSTCEQTSTLVLGAAPAESTAALCRIEAEVEADGSLFVAGLFERPAGGPPGLAKAGLYCTPWAVAEVVCSRPPRRDRFGELSMTAAVQELLGDGRRVAIHVLERGFADIGSAPGLGQARRFLPLGSFDGALV